MKKTLLGAVIIGLIALYIIVNAGGPETNNASRYPSTPPVLHQW